MTNTQERFHLAPTKLEGVIHSVQEIHPEATDDDVRVILLDELAAEEYQDWLDEAPEEEITDRVRQHLETTQP
jgi:ATP:corrinoid adenosyltransferase